MKTQEIIFDLDKDYKDLPVLMVDACTCEFPHYGECDWCKQKALAQE